MGQAFIEFIRELVTRSSLAGSLWISALNHEVWDDAVKDGPIIKWGSVFLYSIGHLALGQSDEVAHRHRRLLHFQSDQDVSFCGLEKSEQALLQHNFFSVHRRMILRVT